MEFVRNHGVPLDGIRSVDFFNEVRALQIPQRDLVREVLRELIGRPALMGMSDLSEWQEPSSQHEFELFNFVAIACTNDELNGAHLPPGPDGVVNQGKLRAGEMTDLYASELFPYANSVKSGLIETPRGREKFYREILGPFVAMSSQVRILDNHFHKKFRDSVGNSGAKWILRKVLEGSLDAQSRVEIYSSEENREDYQPTGSSLWEIWRNDVQETYSRFIGDLGRLTEIDLEISILPLDYLKKLNHARWFQFAIGRSWFTLEINDSVDLFDDYPGSGTARSAGTWTLHHSREVASEAAGRFDTFRTHPFVEVFRFKGSRSSNPKNTPQRL